MILQCILEPCGPNETFEACPCLVTCADPAPNCTEIDCRPGCQCKPGFAFFETECINATECPSTASV